MKRQFLVLGSLVINLETGEISPENGRGRLRSMELETLKYLVAAEGRAVSQTELLSNVWGYVTGSHSHTVRTTIHSLRKKLETDSSRPAWLRTERGRGYRLREGYDLKDGPQGGQEALIAREADLQALQDAFHRCRCVSLVGPPGVGKSRLAEAFLRAQGSGIVLRIDCLGATNEAELLERVAGALSLPRGAAHGAEDVTESIAAAIHRLGPAFLYFDGVEGSRGALSGLIDRWLDSAPDCHILNSSRSTPHLRNAWVQRVDPLPCPPDGAGTEALRESPGGQLLLRRGRALGWEEALTPEDGRALVSVLNALGGLPLAIEVTAAFLPYLPPKAILSSLQAPDSPWMSQDPPHAQGRLEIALERSWAALSPSQQHALLHCASFQGVFDLESATGVIGRGDGVFSDVQHLAEASLLQVESPGWFHTLLPIRHDAIRRSGAEAWEGAKQAHLTYFSALGEAKRCLELIRTPHGLRRLGRVIPELRSALGNARGRPELGLRIARAALVILGEIGPSYDPTVWAGPVLEEEGLSKEGRLELLGTLGFLLVRVGRFPEGLDYLAQAEGLGDGAPSPWVHLGRGRAAHHQSMIKDARRELRRGMALAFAAGQHRLHAIGRQWLIELDLESGEPLEGCLREIESLHQDLLVEGTTKAKLEALHVRGHLLSELGRLEEATQVLREGLTLARAFGMRTIEVSFLRDLSYAFELKGAFEEAAEFARRSLARLEGLDGLGSRGLSLGQYGGVLVSMGRHEAGIVPLKQAVAIFANKDMDAFAIPYRLLLGEAQSKSERPRDALGTLLEAAWLAYEKRLRRERGEAYGALAWHYARTGQFKKAKRWAIAAGPFIHHYGTPKNKADFKALTTSLEHLEA